MTPTFSGTPVLDDAGLQRYRALRDDLIAIVLAQYERAVAGSEPRGSADNRRTMREYLGYGLEFLAPVLEFGIMAPMVDYLRWVESVLVGRHLPPDALVRVLDLVADGCAAHMTAGDGVIITAALQRIRREFVAEHDPVEGGATRHEPEAWAECGEFADALIDGDRRHALWMLDSRLARGRSLIEAEIHLIQPALYEIGRRWQQNRVTVAQEHLATAIARSVMAQGLARSPVESPNGRTVLLACVAGNRHSLGLQMVADAFQLSGWTVQYLGADVPTADLLSHVARLRPDLVGLSASFAHQLTIVREIIDRLITAYGSDRPSVIVGGLGANQFEEITGRLGADGWHADAASAVPPR